MSTSDSAGETARELGEAAMASNYLAARARVALGSQVAVIENRFVPVGATRSGLTWSDLTLLTNAAEVQRV